MNVNQVAETYTNLGRLGRGGIKPPDQQEDKTRDLVEKKPLPEIVKTEADNYQSTKNRQGDVLNVRQAMELTSITADWIGRADLNYSKAELHDITGINLIVPRYV